MDAKVATKIALGYRLDEIKNAVTGNTYAAFEPALDYVAVKFPKWPFDKFVYAKRDLGTQMKATGEVMSISDSFESALMKALRGAEISVDTVRLPKLKDHSDEEIWAGIGRTTDERIFYVSEGLFRGFDLDKIHEITMIDNWFLSKIRNLVTYEKAIAENIDAGLYVKGKKLGFTDKALERISGKSVAEFKDLVSVTYKMVDKIITLHYHVVELEEGQASVPLKPLFVAFCTEHVVNMEVGPDLPEKVDIVK